MIFTSGGTEANNLAVFGLAGAEHSPGHVVSSPIEHPAVAEPIARLESSGFAVDRPHVNRDGTADAKAMAATFRDNTRFATLMLANNETGVLQPVAELAELAHGTRDSHSYGCRASGRPRSGRFSRARRGDVGGERHKFHGPVGVGLLLVRSGVRLGSRLFGGGQQQGRRAGTIAVPLAVGFAKALQRWQSEADARAARWKR